MRPGRRPQLVAPSDEHRAVGEVHALAVATTRGETPATVVDIVLTVDGRLYTATKVWGPLDGIHLGSTLPGWLDGDDFIIDWTAHPAGARRRPRTSRATRRDEPTPRQVIDSTLGLERAAARGRPNIVTVTAVENDPRRTRRTLVQGIESDGRHLHIAGTVPFYARHLRLVGASLPIFLVSRWWGRPTVLIDWPMAATDDDAGPAMS